MIWCCPLHYGDLTGGPERLVAACCGREFPIVAGIPDLRTAHAAWVDLEDDRRRAAALASAVPANEVEASIRWVFGQRNSWTPEMVQRRTAGVLDAVAKLRDQSTGWLSKAVRGSQPLLDVGCGPGTLLAALGSGRPLLGIDVSLEWLVVARRLSAAAGVRAELAAGHAESLPLRAGSMGSVVAMDVLEHVGDQAAMIHEVDRVLASGGVFAAATPNRYSLAAEPHVYIWGVGWLPRKWQARYVRWRTGLPYDFARLLSLADLRRLIPQHSSLRATVEPAPVPASDLRRFSRRRRVLGETYNALLALPPFRAAARRVGPFFHLTAVKPESPAGA